MARGKKIDWSKHVAPGFSGVDVDLTDKKREVLTKMLLDNRLKLKDRSVSLQSRSAELNKKYFG